MSRKNVAYIHLYICAYIIYTHIYNTYIFEFTCIYIFFISICIFFIFKTYLYHHMHFFFYLQYLFSLKYFSFFFLFFSSYTVSILTMFYRIFLVQNLYNWIHFLIPDEGYLPFSCQFQHTGWTTLLF